jgi:hypothetical protein
VEAMTFSTRSQSQRASDFALSLQGVRELIEFHDNFGDQQEVHEFNIRDEIEITGALEQYPARESFLS